MIFDFFNYKIGKEVKVPLIIISCVLVSTVHGATFTFSSFPLSLTHSTFAPTLRGLVLLCLSFKFEGMMGRGNAALLTHTYTSLHTQTEPTHIHKFTGRRP